MEEAGCGVPPTASTKVIHCTFEGSFTGNSCRGNFLEGLGHYTSHPTRRLWHEGKPCATADVKASPLPPARSQLAASDCLVELHLLLCLWPVTFGR